MVLRSLVVIAHEDVGSESAARNYAADGFNTLQILLAGVLAVHEL